MHNQPWITSGAPVAPANPCASLLNQSSQHALEVVLRESVTQRGNRRRLIESAGKTPGLRQTQSIPTVCGRERQHEKASLMRFGLK